MKTFWFIEGFNHISKQRNGCHLLTQREQVNVFCLWTSHNNWHTHTHSHTHANTHISACIPPPPPCNGNVQRVAKLTAATDLPVWCCKQGEGKVKSTRQLRGQAHCHYWSPSVVLQTIIGGSYHKYHFCRDKTRLLSRQKYACDWTFVVTNVCRDKHMYVATKVLLRQKTCFIATNTRLSRQK